MKGDLDKAIVDYTEVIRLDPNNVNAYTKLGVIFLEKGKLEKTIYFFTQFFKLSPQLDVSRVFIEPSTRWSQSADSKKIAETFGQETGGGDIARVEAIFILSYSLWEAGDHEQAIARLGIIPNLDFQQKPSKSTLAFFEDMFALMPESMKKDPQAQDIVAKIRAKMK